MYSTVIIWIIVIIELQLPSSSINIPDTITSQYHCYFTFRLFSQQRYRTLKTAHLPCEKNKSWIMIVAIGWWNSCVGWFNFGPYTDVRIALYTQCFPRVCRILAGLLSSGKLGGREVKTSASVSRRSWVWIPPESPVKSFPQTLGKHWVYSAIHTSV